MKIAIFNKIKKNLTLFILILDLFSLILILKSSEEIYPKFLNKNDLIIFIFNQFPYGNSILFNISIGFLVSSIFYFMVVWLPERRTRIILKRNFMTHYHIFKEEIISIFLEACLKASGEKYSTELVEKLMNLEEFTKYVKEPSENGEKRLYVFLNELHGNDSILLNILVELEVLRDEIKFVLYKMEIDDENILTSLKLLSRQIYILKNRNNDEGYQYDEDKKLARFLFELLSGWDLVLVFERVILLRI